MSGSTEEPSSHTKWQFGAAGRVGRGTRLLQKVLGHAGRIHRGDSCTTLAQLSHYLCVNKKLQPLRSICLMLLTDIKFILSNRKKKEEEKKKSSSLLFEKIMDCYNFHWLMGERAVLS